MTNPGEQGRKPPIGGYGREQAIGEGILIDVTREARLAGVQYPVAISYCLWRQLLVPDAIARDEGDDENARLHVFLRIFRWMLNHRRDACEIKFKMSFFATRQPRVPIRAIFETEDSDKGTFTLLLDGRA